MVFNSITFLLFFVVVFFVYWFPLRKSTKAQNVCLLAASYFFYGYADLKMLPLLIGATAVFYFLGIGISRSQSEKTASWLRALGVMLGVGLLLYFKYLDFFIESFSYLFESMGLHTNWHAFNIIMPLGVSFFTFKLISYVVDIFNGEIEPTRDVVEFATYIAFFPCILSGPIDKPKFISQLKQKREFNYGYAVDGVRQILWGLFKKIVVADNCALFVDDVFATYTDQMGGSLLLAAGLCVLQVYADFSGYSDMAIGVGKLLGFSITRNFNYPLFALNIADYWRRWHMSLTSWVTDYVFTPLNFRFRRWGRVGVIFAIIINMMVVGLWHGANWTFVLFGLYHGLLFLPLILSGSFMKKDKMRTNRLGLPVLKDFGRMVLTFVLVALGGIIFRVESVGQAWECFLHIFSTRFFTSGVAGVSVPRRTLLFIVIMLIVEWAQRNQEHGLVLSGVKSCCSFLYTVCSTNHSFISSSDNMRRFLINLGITFVVLLVVAWGFDVLLTNNLRRSDARMFNTYNAIYSDTLRCDAVIMGSSRGQVQYNPAVFDSILGLNSYNLSVDGRCIDAEIVIYNAYRHHAPKPRIIIQNIEFGTLQRSNGYEREQYTPFLCKDDLIQQTKESEGFTWADRWLPLVRYAGYHEVIKEGLGLKNKLNRPEMYKGWYGRDDEWDGEVFDAITTVPFNVNPEAGEMFDDYLARCKKEDVLVVLVYAPIYIGVTEKMDSSQTMFDTYQTFAEKYHFPVLNYTYDSLSYDTNYFYNATHLNKTGAELFSVKLAEDLKELLNRDVLFDK